MVTRGAGGQISKFYKKKTQLFIFIMSIISKLVLGPRLMGFIHNYFIYGQISINDETVGVTFHMGTRGRGPNTQILTNMIQNNDKAMCMYHKDLS